MKQLTARHLNKNKRLFVELIKGLGAVGVVVKIELARPELYGGSIDILLFIENKDNGKKYEAGFTETTGGKS